jgi:dihydroflavonol-4-reductase
MISPHSHIFVTGASGFLGGYIVRSLIQNGYSHITCLKRPSSDISDLSDIAEMITWVDGDIIDMPFLVDVLVDVDAVIHAAAVVSFSPKKKADMMKITVEGTANLVNAALENNITKFVHISSVAAIGRKKPIEDIDEKSIFSRSQYDTTYGLSKFLAEQEVWRGHAEGLNVSILNPSLILGIGKWQQSSQQIFAKVYDGMKYYPVGTTGWVDVVDVATAAVICLTITDTQRYIISAENLSYHSVFSMIANTLKKSPPTKPVPNMLASIIWRLEALRSYITNSDPIITKETIMSTSVISNFDNQKSITQLGITYRPLATTIQEATTAFLTTKK